MGTTEARCCERRRQGVIRLCCGVDKSPEAGRAARSFSRGPCCANMRARFLMSPGLYLRAPLLPDGMPCTVLHVAGPRREVDLRNEGHLVDCTIHTP